MKSFLFHALVGAQFVFSGIVIAQSAEFFVSVRGKDSWSGKLADPTQDDGPFATVTRAQAAVRSLLSSGKTPEPIRVIIRSGTYYLDAPLEFEPGDSGEPEKPVIYAAAAGERPVFSGGRLLKEGHSEEINGRKAWSLDVPEVKRGEWRFRQLFINGERRPRTRLPKKGEYQIESLPGYTGDFLRNPTKQFVYRAGEIESQWRNLQDVEIVAITRWLENRLPIESVNGKTRTVAFDRPSLFALLSGEKPGPYWIENVFEALDTPGQWYLDRPKGKLSYLLLPGEEMSAIEVIAPRLSQLVRVRGRPGTPVHDIRFQGLWNVSGKPLLFARKNFAEWQAIGHDKDGIIADPLFLDPLAGDFQLRTGSPAEQIGFRSWDLSTVGPPAGSLRRRRGFN